MDEQSRVAERTVSLGTYDTTDPAPTSLVRYRIRRHLYCRRRSLSTRGSPFLFP
ncbi:unnamed protein product, partial [Musa hybrid cultivar]